jgi:hypothetical protein
VLRSANWPDGMGRTEGKTGFRGKQPSWLLIEVGVWDLVNEGIFGFPINLLLVSYHRG